MLNKQYHKFDFSFHYLKDIPEEILDQTHLHHLNLSFNQISVLPPRIDTFTSLLKLSLANNHLQYLPKEIGALVHLQELNVFHNELVCLPEEIGLLTSLKELLVNDNKITELPRQISGLVSLEGLDCEKNLLTTLPKEIGALAQLKWTIFDQNRLLYLPSTLGNLTSLERLYLDGNRIVSLPHSITSVSSLKWLYLDNNPILDCNMPESPSDIYIPIQEIGIPSLKCLCAKVIFDKGVQYQCYYESSGDCCTLIPVELVQYLHELKDNGNVCYVCRNIYFATPLEVISYSTILWYTALPVSYFVCSYPCAYALKEIREEEERARIEAANRQIAEENQQNEANAQNEDEQIPDNGIQNNEVIEEKFDKPLPLSVILNPWRNGLVGAMHFLLSRNPLSSPSNNNYKESDSNPPTTGDHTKYHSWIKSYWPMRFTFAFEFSPFKFIYKISSRFLKRWT